MDKIEVTQADLQAKYKAAHEQNIKMGAQAEEWRQALATASATIDALIIALHDAIKAPKGTVPDSAKPYYVPDAPDGEHVLTDGQADALAKLVDHGVSMAALMNPTMKALANMGYAVRKDCRWHPTNAGVARIKPYMTA